MFKLYQKIKNFSRLNFLNQVNIMNNLIQLFFEDNSNTYADSLYKNVFSNPINVEKSGINFNFQRLNKSIKAKDLKIYDASTAEEFSEKVLKRIKQKHPNLIDNNNIIIDIANHYFSIINKQN